MKTCSIEGCDNPVLVLARGWCRAHYRRWQRHGSPMAGKRTKNLCAVDGCEKPAHGFGLCAVHLYRFHKHGDPKGGRTPPGTPAAFIANAILYRGTDCILWPYASKQGGYGKIGRRLVTHVVCEAIHGPRPSPKYLAAHNCRNPACINPGHLRWATHKENSADMLMHGTRLLGERANRAKLTAADVIAIRSQPNRSQADMAREYGVAPSNICVIRKRKNWRHIP